MGWDTEGRRKLLLEAATRHFAAAGLAGSRVDSIARDAGVNKERIYQYFGDKNALFAAVQRQAMEDSVGSIRIAGDGPAAIADYARQLFDSYTRRPELARLLAWEALEYGEPLALDIRSAAWTEKVEATRAALPGLDGTQARHLLLSVFTLVTGWWSLRQMGAVILPGQPDNDTRRDLLIAQVTSLTEAAVAASAV